MASKLTYHFSGKQVDYYVGSDFTVIDDLVSKDKCIIITDETIYRFHKEKFTGRKTIVIPAGEERKNQQTVDLIINELIALEADRKSVIIGVGGGVITDISGYVASIYMRGLKFGFVPTTILAQVDASIGGKNGIDVGLYKNLIGVIRQPEFILFDFSFLQSLPSTQWINGFAEIPKHACIKDASLFQLLEKHQLQDFKTDKQLLEDVIQTNINIKSGVVSRDEFEQGERKLLNFGHTLGHAIENMYQLPHGFAVSIGMAAASTLSVQRSTLSPADRERIISLLKQYYLPVAVSDELDHSLIMKNLRMDKKRSGALIDFILLSKIGDAVIKPISYKDIDDFIVSGFADSASSKLHI